MKAWPVEDVLHADAGPPAETARPVRWSQSLLSAAQTHAVVMTRL